MNNICILLPYFGTFPAWVDVFMMSCRKNSTIDFHIITDVQREEQEAPNIFFHYVTFNEMQQRVRKRLKAVLPNAYTGEKNFNPIYMILKIVDNYPVLVLNDNLCYVEYQETDSMSRAIYSQYVDSPRSFAKLRCMDMRLKHTTWKRKLIVAGHYVSSCLLAKSPMLIWRSPRKILTTVAIPLGLLIYGIILYKNRISAKSFTS